MPIETREVWLTAYSSTPEETDDTPFVTATGNHVRDGIVATNFLPFGTRVRIPEVFGDKIFVVDDRMHPRKTDFMDVWMPSKQDALNLGIRRTNIVVLAPIGTPDSRN
ncbi:MAG: 3D domain-containing protein [Parcubacteria group bacterium]|nr:3D domain-containing protein [Parcubacteria group bacterium]